MTDHPQVPFVTLDGKNVTVDVGMSDVLVAMRTLGVNTQYSCQHDMSGAYVLSTGQSCQSLLRKMRRNYRRGSYSLASMRTAKSFLEGYHDWDLTWWKIIDAPAGHRVHDRLFRQFWSNGKDSDDFTVELQLSNFYGYRICLRWPAESSDDVLTLLLETIALARKTRAVMEENPTHQGEIMHKQWKILVALLTVVGGLFAAKQLFARKAG